MHSVVLFDQATQIYTLKTAAGSAKFYRKLEIRLDHETKRLMKEALQRNTILEVRYSENEAAPLLDRKRRRIEVSTEKWEMFDLNRKFEPIDDWTSEEENEDMENLPTTFMQSRLDTDNPFKNLSNDHRLLNLRHRSSYTISPRQTRASRREVETDSSEHKEWAVARIMASWLDWYLVFWDDWNFTHCTWETKDSLEHSPDLVRDFEQYQAGRAAILQNVQSSDWLGKLKKDPKLHLRDVPYVHDQLSDEELAFRLEDPRFKGRLGIWKLKMIELDWLKILDPRGTGIRPPLYLEYMHARSRVDILPTDFKFTIDYSWSFDAHAELLEPEDEPHLCVFQSPNNRCSDCENLVQADLTPSGSIDFRNIEFSKNYVVIVCSESKCVCPGGWEACQRKIPTYPRKLPLAIFHDPRYRWGVRALTDIPKGTIICEYVGRVMTVEEGDDRSANYQFGFGKFVVDATHEGNESRFLAHCCDPNCVVVNIYEMAQDMSKCHRGIMVALRDIVIGEDLHFDYHPRETRPRNNYAKCRCAAKNCRGWL